MGWELWESYKKERKIPRRLALDELDSRPRHQE